MKRGSAGVIIIASMMLTTLTSTAYAHALLVHATPAPDAVLDRGGVHVVLEFNARIDSARSVLLLCGPSGTTRVPIVAQSLPNGLEGKWKAVLPGAYVLRWQVLATDGHITRGEIPFKVR